MIIEQFKDAFIDEVMSDEWQEEILPLKQMMAYYRCAIMEVETKFRVLNEELSLCYDRNPIESIHSRLKSNASITKKLKLKGYPINVETMKNIFMILRDYELPVHLNRISIIWLNVYYNKMIFV